MHLSYIMMHSGSFQGKFVLREGKYDIRIQRIVFGQI